MNKFFAVAAAVFFTAIVVAPASAGPCPVLKKNGSIVAKATSAYKPAKFGGYYHTNNPKKFIVYLKNQKKCIYLTLKKIPS